MTGDVGTSVSDRHPDVTALSTLPQNTVPALTGGLQHLDGERLRIQLRKLPVNKLPVRQCLTLVEYRFTEFIEEIIRQYCFSASVSVMK